MSYDPLFDPRYVARQATEIVRHDPQAEWVAQHFNVREKGRFPSGHWKIQISLEHPCAMADLPQAGTPWKLPPPVIEGQELNYRFYDDATLDREVFVVAVQHNGALQWLQIKATQCPRRMVGTVHRKCCPGGACST